MLVLSSSEGGVTEEFELTELSHLANYTQPHAPGALLKAAFICAGIVDFPSDVSLPNQLTSKFGSGFKIQSMSCLPQGSGEVPFIRQEEGFDVALQGFVREGGVCEQGGVELPCP